MKALPSLWQEAKSTSAGWFDVRFDAVLAINRHPEHVERRSTHLFIADFIFLHLGGLHRRVRKLLSKRHKSRIRQASCCPSLVHQHVYDRVACFMEMRHDNRVGDHRTADSAASCAVSRRGPRIGYHSTSIGIIKWLPSPYTCERLQFGPRAPAVPCFQRPHASLW